MKRKHFLTEKHNKKATTTGTATKTGSRRMSGNAKMFCLELSVI